MFTGDLILADQALHLGLVDHVVPKGEGLAYAKKLAEKINRFSFPALLESKKQSMKVFKAFIGRIQLEAQLFEQVF